jgi:hypothetical protein
LPEMRCMIRTLKEREEWSTTMIDHQSRLSLPWTSESHFCPTRSISRDSKKRKNHFKRRLNRASLRSFWLPNRMEMRWNKQHLREESRKAWRKSTRNSQGRSTSWSCPMMSTWSKSCPSRSCFQFE